MFDLHRVLWYLVLCVMTAAWVLPGFWRYRR